MATTAVQGIMESLPSSIASELEGIANIENIGSILEQVITLIP